MAKFLSKYFGPLKRSNFCFSLLSLLVAGVVVLITFGTVFGSDNPPSGSLLPVFSGISPATGPLRGNTTVTISGKNFKDIEAVSFGGIQATSFRVESTTRIVVVTPAHRVGTVKVIFTKDGKANLVAGSFTYQASLPRPGATPVITSTAPPLTITSPLITPTPTPTISLGPLPTATEAITPLLSTTASASPVVSATATLSPTQIATADVSASPVSSATPTILSTPSLTPDISASPIPTSTATRPGRPTKSIPTPTAIRVATPGRPGLPIKSVTPISSAGARPISPAPKLTSTPALTRPIITSTLPLRPTVPVARAGLLSITSLPAAINYNGQLDGENLVLTSQFSIGIEDTTGSNQGWHLLMSSGVLRSARYTIPAENHTIQNVTISNVTGIVPINLTKYPMIIPVKSESIFSAAANSGAGQSTLSFLSQILIPADALAGFYNVQFSFTVVSGP